MKITIEFSTENASFEDNPHDEIDNIMHIAANKIKNLLTYPNTHQLIDSIIDVNGNRIGTITLEQGV